MGGIFSKNCVELPNDIVINEILVRLPAKSLLRCKLVCKEWHSIISSPKFIKQHFEHDSNITRLLVYCQGDVPDLTHFQVRCSYFPDQNIEVPDHLLLWGEIRNIRGPCNGIFCIQVRQQNSFALWNPSTRRLRPLYCRKSHKFNNIGFGMDPLTGDLKIVLIKTFPCISPWFAVYSLSKDSWKYRREPSLLDSEAYTPNYMARNGTYLNGCYYWLKVNFSFDDSTILAFDMHTEKFEDIKMPTNIIDKQLWVVLHVLNGESLALVSSDSKFDGKHIEIWLMEEKGSWNKIFSMVDLPFKYRGSFGFLDRNNLLISAYIDRDTVEMMFDINTGGTRIIQFRDVYFVSNILLISCKESLFSVKGKRHKVQDHDIRSRKCLEFLGDKGGTVNIL